MLATRLQTLIKTTALAAAFAALAAPAAASVITLQTRFTTAGAPLLGTAALDGQYYRDTLDALTAVAPTAGYCDVNLSSLSGISNQGTCGGSNQNIGFAYQIQFGLTPGQAGNFGLQVGPDFGFGGAVFLDGALLAVKTNDLWWNGDYSSSQTFSLASVLGSGNHQLSIYGLEGCCDGGQAARFRLAADQDWTTFASTDGLNRQNVPEPAMPVLVLTALGAAGWLSRRQRHLPVA